MALGSIMILPYVPMDVIRDIGYNTSIAGVLGKKSSCVCGVRCWASEAHYVAFGEPSSRPELYTTEG